MTYLRSLTLLVLFRLFSVFFVVSWFVPDELYQSVEVAHHMIYGTGHLTWEWKHALRSYIHPALVALIYKCLSILGFDSYQSIVYQAPRIVHAIIFAVGDFSFLKLCHRLCVTRRIANLSFSAYLFSWFIFYCAPRTLSNSLETSLTLMALNWFPFEGNMYRGKVWPYIALGTLTIAIRPTVALLWLVFGLHHIYYTEAKSPIRLIIFTVLPVALPIIITTIIIDSWAYGRFTVPLLNFLEFNVLSGGSAHFGVHPWHWYFTVGLPTTFTTHLIPIFVGLTNGGVFRPTLLPFYASSFYVMFHSILPHKEQRFLLPIVPLLCLYCGAAFQKLREKWNLVTGIMFVVNIGLAIGTARMHQVGPIAASKSISDNWDIQNGKMSIAALMPCYSLPGFAFYHGELERLRMLDCAPDLEKERSEGKFDESDEFHENTEQWLNEEFSKEYAMYQRIIMYEKKYRENSQWFEEKGFKECDRVWHSFLLTSSREDHWIVVLCRR